MRTAGGGSLSAQEYRSALVEFDRDYPGAFDRLEAGTALVESADSLARQYWDSGVKTLDYLHVSCARHVGAISESPVVLFSSDTGMKNLATRVGMDVFDPRIDPPGNLEPLLLPL